MDTPAMAAPVERTIRPERLKLARGDATRVASGS